jgi:hypothetical protein
MDSSTQSGAPSSQPPPPASGALAAASPQLSHEALEDFAHRANQQIGFHDQQIRNQGGVIAQLRSEIHVLAEGQQVLADAQAHLERQEKTFTDDQQRRLIEFLTYKPTSEQQMQLFAAFAAWHATEPRLRENRQTEYTTKKTGAVVKYGWADLASVIATGQTAGAMGLFALTRQELDDNGTPVVTGYLIHSGGGCISSGPVPFYPSDNDNPGQAHAAGLTTCRRLALQMVLGLAAERDDDFNAPGDSQPRQARQGNGPQQQPVRTIATPLRTAAGPAGATHRGPADAVRQGPPPGWISKDDRRALEQEMTDPAITPERFQEIESKLLAADQLAKKSVPAPHGNVQEGNAP